MLNYNELKPGIIFIFNNEPWEVLEYNFVRMQKRRPTVQVKIKNLIDGKTIAKTFSQGDSFEEAEIEEKQVKFIYGHRGKYVFSPINQPSQRMEINEEQLIDIAKYLVPDTIVKAFYFQNEIIKIQLPIKMDFKVIESPPSIKGDTASGGSKSVKIETGAIVQTPLFIEEGDIIRVNTQTGEYTERISKKK